MTIYKNKDICFGFEIMFQIQFVLDFNKHLIKIDFFHPVLLQILFIGAASSTAGYQNSNQSCKFSRIIFSKKKRGKGD